LSILTRVQVYLDKVVRGDATPLPADLLDEYAAATRKSLERQLSRQQDKFRLRMSNVGKPLCQLQLESMGVKGESPSYMMAMTGLSGDAIEAMAIAIMKMAGVNVNSYFQEVAYNIGGIELKGSYDVEIDGEIWDIKTASDYSFHNKFGDKGGFTAVVDDDPFGYVSQGYLYATATGRRFAGWIVVNKASGEWLLCETPQNDQQYRDAALRKADENIRAISNGAPFAPQFEPVVETYRRKPTGNMILCKTCEWCSFKRNCFPEVQELPSFASVGETKPMRWYTYVDPKWTEKNNEGELAS